jgi:hypothetical protein
MQIKQLPPACPAKLGRKCSCGFRSLVIEQILSQSISEGLNHLIILSELDNKSSYQRRLLQSVIDRIDRF